ncbi:ABC transporter ATP-binding protein-like [Phanerochaete sordida]|uniref:ABC transporter ATP-binding protein-like n=1 Tax=Phanerochaete sordida TaxID=48140 RepID=A0A9P3GPR8_9APHY|nr:ABC transporter ATP-binding protein-like [Phanerochaete sordida]
MPSQKDCTEKDERRRGADAHLGEVPEGLRTMQLGVWRVVLEPTPTFQGFSRLLSLRKLNEAFGANFVARFLGDVCRLSPGWFMLYCGAVAYLCVDGAVKLILMNRLFNCIEQAVLSDNFDARVVVEALLLRMLFVGIGSFFRWLQEHAELILSASLETFFTVGIMEKRLAADLQVSEESDNGYLTGNSLRWRLRSTLNELFDLIQTVASLLSQIYVAARLVRSQEAGLVLVALALLHPLCKTFGKRKLYGQLAVWYASSHAFRRLVALFSISTNPRFTQEIIGGGLKEYLLAAYRETAAKLEELPCKEPDDMYQHADSPWWETMVSVSEDFPLAFYIGTAVLAGQKPSLPFLATLQQMSASIREAISRSEWMKSTIENTIMHLKAFYSEVPGLRTGGSLPYPPMEKRSGDGMCIEFRDVSFAYKGMPEDVLALRHLSFTIPASALVVIVGANGSGKSSIVKLLTTLHVPSDGSIVIDGSAAEEYIVDDLRASTALLTQDHGIFPLTIAENIGLGDPGAVVDMQRVKEAARLGGAAEFIQKLPQQYEEIIHPVDTLRPYRYPLPEGTLKTFADQVERKKDVSGGEKQRLAAARTFMRLMARRTRLLVVDEPTSAMDPEGECALFEALRARREGRTLVFVTHRFGHLTRHADLILCMQDGRLVESGTHKSLFAQNGVYRKLYDVQARAFTEGVEHK